MAITERKEEREGGTVVKKKCEKRTGSDAEEK